MPDRRERCPANGATLPRRQAAALRIFEPLLTLRSADEPPARLRVEEHRPLTMAARPGAILRQLAAIEARAAEDIFDVAFLTALIAGAENVGTEFMLPFQPTDAPAPDRLVSG